MDAVYERLLDYILELEIIDTHEHLPPCEDAWERPNDVLREYLIHYFSSDLVSAGLTLEQVEWARDLSVPLMERWEVLEPYWDAARHTGYGRALTLAVQGLYGIEDISRDTIEELDYRFQDALRRGDHFWYVLKEKSKIKVSLLDSDLACDRTYFRSVYRMDDFLFPGHSAKVRKIARELGISINSLRDWKTAAEIALDRALEQGAVALKCGLAYLRSLRFDKVTEAEAEEEFNRLFADLHLPDWRPGGYLGKKFQDHMMHHILHLADERGLTVQFHTGLQEGSGNFIEDANPALLTNLFIEYENVKFDIFHMGYPYQQVLSALAKNFRNVYIDMCWAHIISPEASVRALVEWLDTVPANKISAFGGDYCFVDGVYGHQLLARQNVAKALAIKVQEGVFDVERAKELAHWLFIDNPARLFSLRYNLEGS